jgi:hypothetical protein
MPPSQHERSALRRELHDLERTAEEGASSKTPLILIGEMWVVTGIAVLVILGLSLLGYWLAR